MFKIKISASMRGTCVCLTRTACTLTLVGLLSGFAAQVPSPPSQLPPVAPASSSGAVKPAVQTAQAAPLETAAAAAPRTPAKPGGTVQLAAPPEQEAPAAEAPAARTDSTTATPANVAATPLDAQAITPLAGDGAVANVAPRGPLEINTVTGPLALLPYLAWYLDPSGQQSAREVAEANAFSTDWGKLPQSGGPVWLRLQLAPMPSGMPEQMYVHLGRTVPGAVEAWMVRPHTSDLVPVRPDESGVFPILYSQPGGMMLFRLEGWPTVGFAPWIGSQDPETANQASLLRIAALVFLGMATLLSLIRGLIERREWRIWGGLFGLCALIKNLWTLPVLTVAATTSATGTAGGTLSPWDLPALIAPALALFIFPHAGRHLMHPRQTLRWVDSALIIVSVLGLAVGLMPLLPSQGWMLRLTPLWPLGLALTALLTLAAGMKGLAGWGRFFLICLLACSGPLVLPGLLPALTDVLLAGSPARADMLAQGPLIGMTLSMLLLALVGGNPTPRPVRNRARSGARAERGERNLQINTDEDNDIALSDSPAGELSLSPDTKSKGLPLPSARKLASAVGLTLTAKLEKSPQKQTKVAPTQGTKQVQAGQGQNKQAPQAPTQASKPAARLDADLLTKLEECLRVPLDGLLRQAIALDLCHLPEEASRHVAALVSTGRTLTGIITNLSRTGLPETMQANKDEATFDLPRLLRDAHASVAYEAEERNLAVSWYVAPHLGRYYAGQAWRLSDILRQLLDSSVRATARGSVQLWVRRVQESNDPGQLVFTVADTGSGMPPERRNPLLLINIWELAGETGGTVHMDSTTAGTTISFSIGLKSVPAPGATPLIADAANIDEALTLPSLRLIVADDVPSRRQLLAYMLGDLPHEIIEARSATEAVQLHAEIPARMIIFDGNMPEKELIDAVAAIRATDGERSLPPITLLALCGHEAQGERLHRAGMNHILYKPTSRQVLRQAVLHLAPVPGMELPPLPVSEAPKPAQTEAEPHDEPLEALDVVELAENTRVSEPLELKPASKAEPVATPESAPALELRFDAMPVPETLQTPSPQVQKNRIDEADLSVKPVQNAQAQAQSVDPSPRGLALKAALQAKAEQARAGQARQQMPQSATSVSPPTAPQREDAAPLSLPENKAQTEASKQKTGIFTRLSGLLGRRQASPLPDITPAPAAPPRPVSRPVGEPMPIAPGTIPVQKTRVPLRTTAEASEKLSPLNSGPLSENGVGEPKPIRKQLEEQNATGATGATGDQQSAPLVLDQPDKNEELSLPVDQAVVEPDQDQAPGPLLMPSVSLIDDMFVPNVEPVVEPNVEPTTHDLSVQAPTPRSEYKNMPEAVQAHDKSSPPSRRASLLDFVDDLAETAESSTSPDAEPKHESAPEAELESVAAAPQEHIAQGPDAHLESSELQDPLVDELLHALDEALIDVSDALGVHDAQAVIAATAHMAELAEQFGLHVLARLARSMQDMAGDPDGLEAVADTMADLRATVERNRLSFSPRGE